ncbi:MAG: DUF4249 domain-containing protein, partial [Bacteroidales bacterium]|nr:DUF4249 domain-containing protein [Bacteroidales bacterium]
MKKSLLIKLIIVAVVFSCEPKYDPEIYNVEKKIVVDGWIENGRAPIVILTYNTPYFGNLDSASLRQLVASRAKVTVSDGENSEILTLTKDTAYFPPYLYKGYFLKGIIGKTYTLLIEDELDTLMAYTTILPPVQLDSIWFERNTDTSGIIRCILSDNRFERNYYRIFTRIRGKEQRYYPALIANLNDQYFNGQRFSFYINKGRTNNILPIENIYFSRNDSILVRFARVDSISFAFWNSYDEELLNAGNPFAANHLRIPSNIKNGLGIWCGYGASYYFV